MDQAPMDCVLVTAVSFEITNFTAPAKSSKLAAAND
jgi:hypothetical protein